jgi:hypothetical protein
VQHPEDVVVGGVHLDAAFEAAAERLARIGVTDRLRDPVEAGALDEPVGQRVEEPAARAEHEIDGRPRDAGTPRDVFHREGLRR